MLTQRLECTYFYDETGAAGELIFADQVGRELTQWSEDEPTLVETGVGNCQFRIVAHYVADEEDVHVEGPWSEMDGSGPLTGGLGDAAPLQQLAGRRGGRDLEHEIPEIVLFNATDRLSLVNRRDPIRLALGDETNALAQMFGAVTDVRT